MVKHKRFIMKTVNNIVFQMLSSYIMDYNSVMERAQRTDIARRKRGQNCYVSQLKVPNIEECYVINISGESGLQTVVMRYGDRYCFLTEFYSLDGVIFPSIVVLTKHVIERYRVRNNMYTSPMSILLFDILTNTNSVQAGTGRFETALSMKNGLVVPVESSTIVFFGKKFLVNVFITCLSIQDFKVRQLHREARIIKQQMKTRFGEDYIRKHISL